MKSQLTKAITTLAFTAMVLSYASMERLEAGLIENFDPINSSNWTLVGASVDGSPTSEYFSGDALRFSGAADRSATTVGLDLTGGGSISFRLKIGGPNDTAEFEDADEVNEEDVLLRYSVDSGSTWNNLKLFDTEDLLYRDNWGSFSMPLPALGSNTIFQWIQLRFSGSSYDHWAIDDVAIIAVPEQSTLLLGALASLGLLTSRRRRK